jgi:hypothetical protein
LSRFLASILVAALFLAGCATAHGRRGDADEVHLIGLPVTFNMDSKPGPDGFAVRVFVTKGGSAKGSVINSGLLEILMFDGIVGADDVAALPPMQVWKFSPKQLAVLREQTSLGNGYRFALRWQNPPSKSHITVAARYIPPQGEPLYSAPSAIASAVR